MKCKVCGAESGKHPLCQVCNIKKEQGFIIKCKICGQWHYKSAACPQPTTALDEYLYESQKALLSKSEQSFFDAIKACVPNGYLVFPQINLAAFINRTDDSRYRNELFRNVDFLITDSQYSPKIAVEINDYTHLTNDRRVRDEKVQNILEEAGIPIIKLWTSYGVNTEYIKRKITEMLNTPVVRKHHFVHQQSDSAYSIESSTDDSQLIQQQYVSTYSTDDSQQPTNTKSKKKHGCYIATCVYGSYDCPQVWTLRRYRDDILAKILLGRVFICLYYAISPMLVKWFGKTYLFKKFWRSILDFIVNRLNTKGVQNTPYCDNLT